MKLETLNMGAFEVNNYILFDEESKEIVLIDAGGDFEMTKSAIDKYDGTLKYILNTHGHMDHIAGDADLQNHYYWRWYWPWWAHSPDSPCPRHWCRVSSPPSAPLPAG